MFFDSSSNPITGARIRREHWNRNDVTHRWNACYKDLAGVSSGIKKIIFILLAGRDVTGERVRRAVAFVCAAAFSAAHKAGRYDDDCERDTGFGFHFDLSGCRFYFTVMKPLVPCE
jgi:hypothetical protein